MKLSLRSKVRLGVITLILIGLILSSIGLGISESTSNNTSQQPQQGWYQGPSMSGPGMMQMRGRHRMRSKGRKMMKRMRGISLMLKELDPEFLNYLEDITRKVREGKLPRRTMRFATSQLSRELKYYYLAKRSEQTDPRFSNDMKALIKQSLVQKKQLIDIYIKYQSTQDDKERKYLEEKYKLVLRSLFKLEAKKRRLSADFIERHIDELVQQSLDNLKRSYQMNWMRGIWQKRGWMKGNWMRNNWAPNQWAPQGGNK